MCADALLHLRQAPPDAVTLVITGHGTYYHLNRGADLVDVIKKGEAKQFTSYGAVLDHWRERFGFSNVMQYRVVTVFDNELAHHLNAPSIQHNEVHPHATAVSTPDPVGRRGNVTPLRPVTCGSSNEVSEGGDVRLPVGR